jgi:hypothetical protein
VVGQPTEALGAVSHEICCRTSRFAPYRHGLAVLDEIGHYRDGLVDRARNLVGLPERLTRYGSEPEYRIRVDNT